MNEAMLLEVAKEAIMTLILVILPILLTALFIGLFIGILQTLTQVQEMTLVFVPKILAVFIVAFLSLSFIINKMTVLAHSLYDRIVVVGS